jgi:hypothetical protein
LAAAITLWPSVTNGSTTPSQLDDSAFQPGSRWTYYLCAATEYDGIDGPVLTGYCVSPLGPDCDEFGDQALAEIARVRLDGLPPERDLHFEPVPLSEVEAHVARHGCGP